jgi:hypothetical protein
MSEKNTPAERAAIALTSSHTFCNLLAQARQYKFPGWWDGSAFRRHPCGVVQGTLLLTNHWHVDDHCDVQITDGGGWNMRVSHDSFGHDSPHPKPLGGVAVKAWHCGKWADSEFREALEPKLLDLLTRIARHVQEAEERERVAQQERNAAFAAEAAARKRAALAAACGTECSTAGVPVVDHQTVPPSDADASRP